MKTKVDDVLLMKYMQGLCTEKETDEISHWIEESEENRKTFRDAHHVFESVLMSVDPATLRLPDTDRKKKRKRFLRFSAAFTGAAAAITLAVLLSVHFIRLSLSHETVLAEVPAGKMMSLTLADGTVIDLNSGARLEYPAIFYGKNRDVKLEGEAMFKVSHDPSRPFTVSTFAADIEVLGTEFNVMADSREGIFSTSLIEGSVRIRDISGSGTAYTLVPDQSIILDHGRFRIEDGLDPQALYWTEGLINIAGIPFEELMRRFERAFDTDIVIDRQEMPVIECTSGEIRVSDGIGNALRILQHVADFEYVIEPGENLIIIR